MVWLEMLPTCLVLSHSISHSDLVISSLMTCQGTTWNACEVNWGLFPGISNISVIICMPLPSALLLLGFKYVTHDQHYQLMVYCFPPCWMTFANTYHSQYFIQLFSLHDAEELCYPINCNIPYIPFWNAP